jgi:hypothetical protein
MGRGGNNLLYGQVPDSFQGQTDNQITLDLDRNSLLNMLLNFNNNNPQKEFTGSQLMIIEKIISKNDSFEDLLFSGLMFVSKGQPALSINDPLSYQQKYNLVDRFAGLLAESRYIKDSKSKLLANQLSERFSDQFFSSSTINNLYYREDINVSDDNITKMLKPYFIKEFNNSDFQKELENNLNSLMSKGNLTINPLIMTCESNDRLQEVHIVKNTPSAHKNKPSRALCGKQFKGKQNVGKYVSQISYIYQPKSQKTNLNQCSDCQMIERKIITKDSLEQRLLRTPSLKTIAKTVIEQHSEQIIDNFLKLNHRGRPYSIRDSAKRLKKQMIYEYCLQQVKLMNTRNHPAKGANLSNRSAESFSRTQNKIAKLIKTDTCSLKLLEDVFASHPEQYKIYL